MAEAELPEWMILTRHSKVTLVGRDGDKPDLEDFTLVITLAHPPAVSVPELLLPKGSKEDGEPWPSVVAVAPTLIVLFYPPIKGTAVRRRYIVDNSGRIDYPEELKNLYPFHLDERTEITTFPAGYLEKVSMPGVVAHPSDLGRYAIAGLRASVKNNGDVVRKIYSITHDSTTHYADQWKMTRLPGVPEDQDWNWDDVVSDSGSLFWIDNRQGIFYVNPFEDEIEVNHVPLPPAVHHGDGNVDHGRDGYHQRFVQFSASRFRCVDVCFIARRHIKVTVRTLGPDWEWTGPDYAFTMREIWATASFQESLMPSTHNGPPRDGVPTFALMSPVNPDELFFFTTLYYPDGARSTTWLYRVDGRNKRLLGYQEKVEKQGLGRNARSTSIRAWKKEKGV